MRIDAKPKQDRKFGEEIIQNYVNKIFQFSIIYICVISRRKKEATIPSSIWISTKN